MTLIYGVCTAVFLYPFIELNRRLISLSISASIPASVSVRFVSDSSPTGVQLVHIIQMALFLLTAIASMVTVYLIRRAMHGNERAVYGCKVKLSISSLGTKPPFW